MKKLFTFGVRSYYLLLQHLLTSVSLLLLILSGNQLQAQIIGSSFTPASCGNVNCTANDVRVIGAYLSGPGGTPINCAESQPFLNAELHLVVYSNTQRKGVSISGNFNIQTGPVTNTILFANCFTNVTLNNNGNNDLFIAFPLSDAVCSDGFNLNNLFVSWGTGKKDFCDGSDDGHCPETPSKCRYTPGETIPVSVKLEVDFSSVAGICSDGGDSKAFEFTPSIVTEKNIVYPVTFTWDFGDGSPTQTTTASSLADVVNATITHTYAAEDIYTVTLIGSDASPDPNTVFSVTSTHTVLAVSCCNLTAPSSGGDKSGCEGATLTAIATGGTGENITWFDAATDGNEVADPSLSTVGTVIYYAEASTANCVSPERTPVTLTIAANPAAPKLSVVDNCDGTSTVTATLQDGVTLIDAADLTWSNGATDNPISVTTTDEITATVKSGDCTSAASNAVTPSPKERPAIPEGLDQTVCSPANLTAAATGSNVTWYDAATDGSVVADPSLNTIGTITYYAEASALGCVSTARIAIKLTINATPDAPKLFVVDNCDGTSTVTATLQDGVTLIAGADLTWSNGASGNPITVTSTDAITATVKAGDCTSGSSNTVTPAPKTRPAKPVGSDQTACSPASLTATATGSNVTWYNAATDGSIVANPTLTSAGSVIYYAQSSFNGCVSAERTAITLTIRPTPSCTISNTTSSGSHAAILGVSNSFSGPSGANFKYEWSFSANTSGASFAGGASTATTQTVSVTATTVGSYTLSLKVTDETYAIKCNATCTYAMTISPSGPFYTVTQGFYGNVGGKVIVPAASCSSFVAGTKGNVDGLIAASIKRMPAALLKLGIPANNRTFVMGATATEDKNLITYLPAGQAAAVITANAGTNNNTNITTNLPKLSNKKISSILLGQTITLKLNVYIPGNTLGTVPLKTGYLTVQKADLSKCPTIKLVACSTDASAISSLKLSSSAGLNAWINSGNKTVMDLLNLDSAALGGGPLPAGVTLSDLNEATDVINRSFDGAKYFLGYYATAKSCSAPPAARPSLNQNAIPEITSLTVEAYPNPFTDKVRFVIESPTSGNASLDIYNMIGQKVGNLYSGYLSAGVKKVVEYKTSPASGGLIYILRVGDQQVNGKVIQIK